MLAPLSCPVCKAGGLDWVKVDSGNKGISASKAVAGGLLFGPIGLAGGLLGKYYETYYCKKCGFKQDYQN